MRQCVFVSATPADYEKTHQQQVVEMIARPTGLVDPQITVKPADTQVDDLLGDLSSSEDHNKLNSEVGSYAGEIKTAIESKFYDHVSFNGMTCYVRVNLAPDGLLLVIRAERGDASLCQAALKAASHAHIPAPPNKAIYQVFKNAPLDFKP